MTKESIANDYLNEQLHKYQDRRIRPANTRLATVLGSGSVNNIGRGITDHLVSRGISCEGHDVMGGFDASSEYDLRDSHMYNSDILVCSTGYSNMDWIENASEADIEQTMRSNLIAPIMATREFVRQTIDKPWLKYIVIIGSMAHRSVLNASSVYCASKAGVNMFARCAGWELTPKGYRVFVIHPSNTEGTPMTEQTIQGIERVRDVPRDEAEQYWGAINLMPRWLSSRDIGGVVYWLVSGEADFMSGSAIELAGGQR